MEPRCGGDPATTRPIAWYREFVPCKALQKDVYAFFSFGPGPAVAPLSRSMLREIGFCDATFFSPQIADGHVSLVFELGRTCHSDGRWRADSTGGSAIGPMSRVGRTDGRVRSEMVGAYFRPARVGPFIGTPVSDLTDQAVAIDALWGASRARLLDELGELDESARINRLELALLECLEKGRLPTQSIRLERLASSVLRGGGRVTVEELARLAGVSRQHLTRQFHLRFGIGPKLYCRLARFQAGLKYAGSRTRIDWARVAMDMGYADQSHMIAEFRQFSGHTPQALAESDWFHPFVERAKSGGIRME
jgi:AraC-like DNA-binding protein